MRRLSQRTTFLTALATFGGAALLSAHDFWLVPVTFDVAPGETLEVQGQTSSAFPTSESAVALDRLEEAMVYTGAREIPVTDRSHRGTSLLLRARLDSPGQVLVGVRIHWRSVRESPESFRRYLVLEGAPEALARYEREGLLPTDSITRRYAKYAKTVAEIGSGGPRAYQRILGHPLELVPASDPHALRAGDTLRVVMLRAGRPLAGAKLHAGVAPRPDGQPMADLDLVTDDGGQVQLPLPHAGAWNVRAIHIEPGADRTSADWDVHWATLVFRVRDR